MAALKVFESDEANQNAASMKTYMANLVNDPVTG
jgi:hypothetical protein